MLLGVVLPIVILPGGPEGTFQAEIIYQRIFLSLLYTPTQNHTHEDNHICTLAHSDTPASSVIAVTVLLTGALPAALEDVTIILYILFSCSPDIS